MFKILTKFWPVFIPIALYFVWFLFFRKKKGEKDRLTKMQARLWIITLSSSIIIALITIIILAMSLESNKDAIYKPAEYKNGEFVPGRMEQPDESK